MSVSQAEQLRNEGLTYPAIAERLGVSKTTVMRWLRPDYAEASRKRSRERKRERREPCIDCGGLKSYDRPDNERCAGCQHEHDYGERNARLVEMWEADVPVRAIAAELGVSVESVYSHVDNERHRNGAPITLRRRRDRELWPEIERLWNAGTPGAEIATRLDTSRENIYQMISMMRARGIEMATRENRWTADAIAELQTTWNGGGSQREIADQTGLALAGVGVLISRFRRKGYDFERRRKAAA